MSLYLYIVDPVLRHATYDHVQASRPTDSGCDLLCPETAFPLTESRLAMDFHLGVFAAATDARGNPMPCILMARSSMSQTPLRMSNQIGLIDAGYRGELMARVDFVDPSWKGSFYTVSHGRRMFQLVQHNWLPWDKIIVVESPADLPQPPDNRGAGGFGSTGS